MKALVNQVRVSVYFPNEVELLLNHNIHFDMIQFPFNVFDQRFKNLFVELKKRDVEIHVRSVFLQGLFFLDIEQLPQQFKSIKNLFKELRKLCRQKDIPLAALLLNYAVLQPEIDKVVIGVTSLQELKNNMRACEYIDECAKLLDAMGTFSVSDEQIIIPFNWR